MVLDWIANHWNDALTVFTFIATATLAFYQIRYYRSQIPSLEIVDVTDAEYTDFDEYTTYEFTVQLKNDGRDPVSIPDAELTVGDEDIEVNTDRKYAQIGLQSTGARLPDHEFRTIRLGSTSFDHIELFGTGDPVGTTDALTGELWMNTSVGPVETEVTFDRAP